MAVKSIIIKEGQTIYDVSVQLYGNIEQVYKIIADNPDISFLHDSIAGKEIVYDEQSTDITDHFKVNLITLVSAGATGGGAQANSNQLSTNDGVGLQTDDSVFIEID